MFEHHSELLLPWREFLLRLARHGGLAGLVLLFSEAVGILGFHYLGPQDWLEAFENASMLLGGMGPVGTLERPEGKIFASFYALYAGMVFLGVSALLLAPVLHRFFHVFLLEEKMRRK